MPKGAHRVINYPRERNGRVSRRRDIRDRRQDKSEREARAIAVATRARHAGLPEDIVLDPRTGTVHGKMRMRWIDEARKGRSPAEIMRLQGVLSADQYDAAEWYLAKRNAYLRSILADTPGIGDRFGMIAPEEPEAYREWARVVGEVWREIRDCLIETQQETRAPILRVVDCVLERQIEMPYLEGTLRQALNAIHKRFMKGGANGRGSA